MTIKIALAGNPNSGKTTLFNKLTGSNQFVGNWPGVTVEKKGGKLKNHKDVVIMDLPGIYSLSPYTLEEVVSRNYLIDERPDAILNIVDGTNLERNLYLTTQLTELGIPVVVAVNMMDVVEKTGDFINTANLAKELGCQVVKISALKGTGVMEAAEAAIKMAQSGETLPQHRFNGSVEHAIAHIEEAVLHNLPEKQQRWYAIKLFERDEKIIQKLNLDPKVLEHIETDIVRTEKELDDDSESIITSERYAYIDKIIKDCQKLKNKGRLSTSDKIDKVVTNRFLALPIFAVVIFIIYFVSVTTVGTYATDWANDGVFGEGWHLLGNGSEAYEEALENFDEEQDKIEQFIAAAEETGIDVSAINEMLKSEERDEAVIDDFIAKVSAQGSSAAAEITVGEDDPQAAGDEKVAGSIEDKKPAEAIGTTEAEKTTAPAETLTPGEFKKFLAVAKPDPADYGIWIPGVPVLIGGILESMECAEWLQGLILDGIVAGVGAVLGFVPQMLILFFFLAFLEGCGYMARVAFIMDRIFRKFGLSGKSFIPILVGTGCGVPGIMASRTIENDRDRKMTIMTTTFIPCSAKLPIIALIAGALFGGEWWVAPSAYFVGIAAIICSGIILKKTRLFAGDVSPFVMELPAYHMPPAINIVKSMMERSSSFIKKAGTIILLATVFVWFTSSFGFEDGSFGMVDMENSMLAAFGTSIAWIFAPLGWGQWQAAVATLTGLIAKENVVGTFGILFGYAEVAEDGQEVWQTLAASFTTLSAYSYLVFNLLCAPCFAAMGAIRREMNNAKWFWLAIGYQCGFAYIVSLCVYQLGMLLTTGEFGAGTAVALLIVVAFIYLLFRKQPEYESKKLIPKQEVSA